MAAQINTTAIGRLIRNNHSQENCSRKPPRIPTLMKNMRENRGRAGTAAYSMTLALISFSAVILLFVSPWFGLIIVGAAIPIVYLMRRLIPKVREYARQQGLDAEKALEEGMQEKAKEFAEAGGEIYS